MASAEAASADVEAVGPNARRAETSPMPPSATPARSPSSAYAVGMLRRNDDRTRVMCAQSGVASTARGVEALGAL